MHRVRPLDRLGRRFGKPEVANLARFDELRHRADRLLDRDAEVDAVLVVEVDVIEAEPSQRGFARLPYVLGVATHLARAVVVADVAELRREHDLVPPVADRFAHELLVRTAAVHVGRVEEVDAELERSVDRRDRLALVGRSVELRHPHAAEAESGDLESLCAELASVHASTLPAPAGAKRRGRRTASSW